MSTFGGVVVEFPDIRIDFFRPIRDRQPPRACFLSHVHSDHLAGLENKTFHGNFLYCSPATKEILLRLKKYPQRLNFAKGMLETMKVTYDHLKDRLKTIPLETPTRIELKPGNDIQVTLFDANHCTGAVMFLIEGEGKAILYTGDIRSEPWFVNNLTRNPFLLEYTGGLKKLDCIYLDTSNTQPIPFPSKADGLKELLQKVVKYPADTVFHFEAWTFGYEEVWMALSRALKSPIHVDNYKLGLYSSLRGKPENPKDASEKYLSGPFLAHEGPVLTGYKCGNTPQAGCLTSDKSVRIHSCEKGMHCNHLKNDKTVWITPIIARTQHGEIAEIGVGGGGGDLNQQHLELELNSENEINEFAEMAAANTETPVLIDIKRMLLDGLRSNLSALSLDGIVSGQGGLPLKKLVEALAAFVTEKRSASLSENLTDKVQTKALPRTITFPYSRHSSYAELCHLVKIFDPKDVYPCTVEEVNWDEDDSMEALFGHECSAALFRHDREMRELHADRHLRYNSQQTHTTATSDSSSQMLPPSSPVQRVGKHQKLEMRRNSRGLLRPFDADGNEYVPPGFTERPRKTTVEDHSQIIQATPPHEIIAQSPGSESQNLKRKAIDKGMREESAKRSRQQLDGPSSQTPAASVSNPSLTPGNKLQNQSGAFELSYGLEIQLYTPGSDVDTPQSRESLLPLIVSGREFQAEDDSSAENEHEQEENIFWDAADNTFRCKMCGHETWSGETGFCTGDCPDGPDEAPYFELLYPETGPHPSTANGEPAKVQQSSKPDIRREILLRPRIVENEYVSDSEQILNPDLRRDMVGDFLDDHSDAYDTADEEPEYISEYDLEDTFIDDATINFEPEGEDASASDEETDYREVNKDLQARFDRLLVQYVNLLGEREELRRDILGSDYDGTSPSDMEDMDEEGVLVVNVNNPDPNVVELVLSQAQDQSQESEISPERVRDRAKAFEAVGDDGQGWQNISLVSTGDNHTHEEIEL